MPRKSAEDRSGAYWRSGNKPPSPPDILSPRARALWRRIVRTKPCDYFEPAAQELLAQFCELSITQRLNFEMLRRDPLNPEWQTMSARLQAPINSLAVKLRLSPSAVLSKKDGRLDEKEVDIGANVLLFGGREGTRF
jgi:phage terminase small subunit